METDRTYEFSNWRSSEPSGTSVLSAEKTEIVVLSSILYHEAGKHLFKIFLRGSLKRDIM